MPAMLLFACSLFPAFNTASADNPTPTRSAATLSAAVTDSATIHFRQSKWNLDPTLDGNGEELDSLINHIRTYDSDNSRLHLRRVRVVGGASPEGSIEFNRRLSRLRADRIFKYMQSRVVIPDSLTSFAFLGRDWQGLRELAANDPNLPDREPTLALLDDIIAETASGSTPTADRLTQLKRLCAGRPYSYMYSHLFPQLRESRLLVDYVADPLPPAPLAPIPVDLGFDFNGSPTPLFSSDTPTATGHKPFYMGLKTNMLYDALAVPNLGAEFYLGKNWSIAGNWMYAWWSKDSKHRYWRIYGGDIALRKWFGTAAERKPLTGHHLGVYAGIVTYDFEFGGKGYMGGIPGGAIWDRCQYVAGVEYGYSLPIARRLNIDFTIGIGYRGGKYLEYEPANKFYMWESTHHVNWIGPTKLEVSLVWLIGRGNFNVKKGGAQ